MRILALGHDAYRAGSQIEFLHTLRWLRAHHDGEISLVLKAGGTLLPEYQKLLPTTVLQPFATGRPTSPVGWLDLLRRRLGHGRSYHPPRDVDVVYANSAATASLAVSLAAEVGAPVVCHVHELEFSIRRFAGDFAAATAKIGSFIAVSGAVKANLVDNHGVDPAKIHLVHGAVPQPVRATAAHSDALRRELGIPSSAVVVGGCGTLDWRKAPEVFLLIAKACTSRPGAPATHFLWVGGEPDAVELVRHDLDRLGLRHAVTLVGMTSQPTRYFELFDVFLLTSREDPFPLVALEAAALALPVVCFADGGGMPEFVQEDAGLVVPYLDVDAAADSVLRLAGSPSLRRRLGERAATKVGERCAPDVVGPQIASVLDGQAAA